jgi:hypothetical protein
LTPIGPAKTAIRSVDDWVREVWVACGNDVSQLGDEVLVVAFSCVPNGSVN